LDYLPFFLSFFLSHFFLFTAVLRNVIINKLKNMNSLTIDHLIRAAHLFEQQNVLQLGLSTRGVEIDERLSKMAFTTTTYNPPAAALSGYCTPYSGNSSTSSLRSSPTNSMLSSGPTSPLHHHHHHVSTSTSQPSGIIKKSKSSHSTKQSRAAHNELEKNRRANLRSYLDQIKAILPPEYDSTRDTTLSLLTRARNHLRILGHRKNEMLCRRNDIVTENAKLKERIEKAKAMRIAKRYRKQEEQQQQQQQQQQQEQNVQEECTPTVTPMITSRNGSPIFLEYSPSTKPPQLFIPSPTDRMVTIDPYLEGLLPPVPLSYPYLHQMQANRAAMV
jgi:hypothetical protein